uniref:t-SNARE coiled-coil homology domain-containing protein n=1 Tax=Rhodosorus marinus TaxID=101924 RepID=A0A7S0BG98_9RHOD|mmetsp:Transcript_15355/g.22535  ORF Transcript_15355/g.22535 Transcript_15355/m.22535 type:complete len:232 (+) Transcript_15355:168-863(+)
MSGANGDPFDVVKYEVEQNLDKIKKQFVSIELGGGAQRDLGVAKEQLQSSVRNIEWDLQDLDETIAVVIGNRSRFNLSDVDIHNRRRFVLEARSLAQKWKERIDQLGPVAAPHARNGNPVDEISAARNEEFIQNEFQHQEMILRQQDQGLDDLAKTVQRIGDMGMVMHRELNEQAEILEDIDSEMDSATNRLQLLQRKLDQIVAQTGRDRLCLIFWLFLAFIILAILAVVL